MKPDKQQTEPEAPKGKEEDYPGIPMYFTCPPNINNKSKTKQTKLKTKKDILKQKPV